MSLACLACHGVESSPEVMRSYSSRSDTEVTCCWIRKASPPAPTPELSAATTMGSKVAPDPPRSDLPHSPRLMRCRAVRRDLFIDWSFLDDAAAAVHHEPEWRNINNVVPVVP